MYKFEVLNGGSDTDLLIVWNREKMVASVPDILLKLYGPGRLRVVTATVVSDYESTTRLQPALKIQCI